MKKALLAASAAIIVSAPALAVYPERPITLVVPFAAGGPTDKTARDLAEALRKPLGGAVIVIENKGGGGGTIAATQVARAPSDGYTLMIHHIGMATAPALFRNTLPFKVLEDFTYLGMVQEVPMTLVSRKDLPASNVAELLAWVRAKKGGATLANSGIGSASHLCGLLFMSMAKLDMVTVPYKGTAPAMNDVLAGHVDMVCDQSTNTTEFIAPGKVKAFGVTTKQRVAAKALRDVPSLDEAGLKGFDMTSYLGLYAPKGTPAVFTQRLMAALAVAMRDPEFIARQEAVGARIITDARVTPEGHKRFIASEIERWTPIIKAAGQYAD
ncbi:tripartite tricarboxylate transporter substrate-binding protein (plasmid) [Sphaerotilaceae bacterium SBD11-9]